MVRQDDSSRNVTKERVECKCSCPAAGTATSAQVPATSDDALRLAIKLAVDAREDDRAAMLLEFLKCGAVGRSGDR